MDGELPAALPCLFTVAEVATAIGQTERYVSEQCRRYLWPHRRFARGEVRFTTADVEQILELARATPSEAPAQGLSFAPRSATGRTRHRSATG